MTKSLTIILQYLFIQNSNIYKPLSKKLVLPNIRILRKSFCLSSKALIRYSFLIILLHY